MLCSEILFFYNSKCNILSTTLRVSCGSGGRPPSHWQAQAGPGRAALASPGRPGPGPGATLAGRPGHHDRVTGIMMACHRVTQAAVARLHDPTASHHPGQPASGVLLRVSRSLRSGGPGPAHYLTGPSQAWGCCQSRSRWHQQTGNYLADLGNQWNT